MRLSHFEAFQPRCPRCRTDLARRSPLAIAHVAKGDATQVEEGTLVCSDRECLMEYPILDGTPLLVPAVRRYISDHAAHLTSRDDLSETMESLVGDALGPGTVFDVARAQLSTYAWDSYADLDPAEAPCEPAPGAVVRCMRRGLELLEGGIDGPILDVGCAVGRSTFELGARFSGPVLGIDVSVSMLRLARRVLSEGRVRYPRRRVGLVYDRREFEARFPQADRVDFWICDALALPFDDAALGMAVALNVLDCVASPRDLLAGFGRVLRPGGSCLLSTPHDWSAAATPVEAWIGGHSQRSDDRGASESRLRELLTGGGHPQSVDTLRIVGEVDRFPWHTRLHDRSSTIYDTQIIAARRAD